MKYHPPILLYNSSRASGQGYKEKVGQYRALFHKLMTHKVFSDDANMYLCTVISPIAAQLMTLLDVGVGTASRGADRLRQEGARRGSHHDRRRRPHEPPVAGCWL